VTHVRAFPGSPESVTAARHFVVDLLDGLPAEIIDRVALAVSELATNSVRHARTPFVVSVERAPDVLRIEVYDRGSGAPAPRAPASGDASGRGLRIVERLASDWGVVSGPRTEGGKTVWFSMRLPTLETANG
jgi:anti-sigma regulatory factor (Ser/Thr protein kinase)